MRTTQGILWWTGLIARDESELSRETVDLPIRMCPHCGKTGYLRRHGFLRGKSIREAGLVKRGVRIYCSKRFRLAGCGQTFSIMLAQYIPGHSVDAPSLWGFLKQCMSAGATALSAREKSVPYFSEQSAYRWWRNFRLHQPALRTALTRMRSPPAAPSGGAYGQLLKHIEISLGKDPIEVFQYHFQEGWSAL